MEDIQPQFVYYVYIHIYIYNFYLLGFRKGFGQISFLSMYLARVSVPCFRIRSFPVASSTEDELQELRQRVLQLEKQLGHQVLGSSGIDATNIDNFTAYTYIYIYIYIHNIYIYIYMYTYIYIYTCI